MAPALDSFSARSRLVTDSDFEYLSLPKFSETSGIDISRLPFALKILLENLLRSEDGKSVRAEHIRALATWDSTQKPTQEIAFHPARVVLQDFTGVPAIVDLAAMRDAMARMGGNPDQINPLFPSELVIDHSVQVDSYGRPDSLMLNGAREYERNSERYTLLRWGQTAFSNFQVVPPATGIVHQVNLEYLARVVFEKDGLLYPDTLVGTDSHTTMINGLGVLGWGVGGIEAEAAMLGQPINLLIPEVIGFKLHGRLPEGATATDLVLNVVRLLRDKGVVGKFVEFYGSGLEHLPLADRATIANMSPEFGSTCAIFPIDAETLRYLGMTNRSEKQRRLIESYAKAQGLFRTSDSPDATYTDTLELDLGSVLPTISGPKRPQDKTLLSEAKTKWASVLKAEGEAANGKFEPDVRVATELDGAGFELRHGSVVIAAITSCTNTSNPHVLVAAGLLAQKAVRRGLSTRPWVKSSLAPGSKVVTRYLKDSGLLAALEALKFHVVGYGCTTCIGNSGPLPDPIAKAINEHSLLAVSVLSGNRNFEGRISPDVRANYLASPPLVVAYALAGRMDIDLTKEPLGKDSDGADVFLSELWPSTREISELVERHVAAALFRDEYSHVFEGDDRWRDLPVPRGNRYAWDPKSTYVRRPSFFDQLPRQPPALANIEGARVLLLLGDMVTTDHISPAGSIAKNSPAAKYLEQNGVMPRDFNSYGARRGNHEVMVRGTFANVRLKNRLAPGTEGGFTRHLPSGDTLTIFDASLRYQSDRVPLLVIAGKEYGSGSSRDWAAKGTYMLGVRAVLAESFERIHRSNLIGMGVLPLEFLAGETCASLGLTGSETFSVLGIEAGLEPGCRLEVLARQAAAELRFEVKVRIDTLVELDYYRHGGILPFVLRQLLEVRAPGSSRPS